MSHLGDPNLARTVSGFARSASQTGSVRCIVRTVVFQTMVVCDQAAHHTQLHPIIVLSS